MACDKGRASMHISRQYHADRVTHSISSAYALTPCNGLIQRLTDTVRSRDGRVSPALCVYSADLPTAPVVAVVSGGASIYDAKVLAYAEATPRTLNKHYAQAHQVQTKDSQY